MSEPKESGHSEATVEEALDRYLPHGEAVRAALRLGLINGHALSWDPPALSSAERWSCRCGAAVINTRGRVYGSATEEKCDA